MISSMAFGAFLVGKKKKNFISAAASQFSLLVFIRFKAENFQASLSEENTRNEQQNDCRAEEKI